MSLFINSVTNPAAQDMLAINLQQYSNTEDQMASGQQYDNSSSGNNPVQFAISQIMQENISGFSQGMANANQGVSLVQVATGGLNQTLTVLQQMQQLATESASGLYSSTQLNDMQTQFSSLQTQVNQIAGNTVYNGISLLQNSAGSVTIQAGNGASASDAVTVTLAKTDTTTLGIASSNVSTVAGATSAMSSIDTAINTVSTDISQLGSAQSDLQAIGADDSNIAMNLTDAQAMSSSTDYAASSSNLAMEAIMSQANIAIIAQANSTPNATLQLLASS